jgi:hypothetical protein
MPTRPLLILLLSLLLPACASPSPATAKPSIVTLTMSGPIVDAVTGQVVTADVLIDGVTVQTQTTQLAITIPLHDWQTEIRVRAPGYQDWAVAVQGQQSRRLEGPIRMNPKP